MACPNLKEWLITCCTAGSSSRVLRSFVVEAYFKNRDYEKCPFYKEAAISHAQDCKEYLASMPFPMWAKLLEYALEHPSNDKFHKIVIGFSSKSNWG
jgi:hypothetical protein